MERIPSTLVIHKPPDGADTCLASMRHPLVNNPGQKWLGAIDSGAYQPAAPTEHHAFVKIEDMWSDPMDESEIEEETTELTVPPAVEPTAPRTRSPTGHSGLLHQLYRSIYHSRDKLCFFAHQPAGQTTETWYLVQVNLDKTDAVAAKRTWSLLGTLDDLPPHRLPVQAIWPEVHERTADPLQPYG
jgi:hypothetical protein